METAQSLAASLISIYGDVEAGRRLGNSGPVFSLSYTSLGYNLIKNTFPLGKYCASIENKLKRK